MKNCIVFILMVLTHYTLYAQDYKISFAGTGESSIIDSIEVENINTGEIVAFPGNQVLQLREDKTGINNWNNDNNEHLLVYPNPSTENSIIEFTLPSSGKVHVAIFDLPGRKLASTSSEMNAGLHSFIIKGLGKGIYSIGVYTSKFSCTGKFLSNSPSGSKPEICYKSFRELSIAPANLKSAKADVVLQYKNGDRLKITGKSGIYKTVLTDVPNQSKELKIPFIKCIDADGNNYSVVKIGDQIWMAENLKYLPVVNDNQEFEFNGNCSRPGYGVYGYDGSDVNTAKSQTNYTTYGVLYNWFAVNSGNICPVGWHVPTANEWTVLNDFLCNNAYGYEGNGDDIAKSLTSTSGWLASSEPGTVGNDQGFNNSSGFSALPGGYRFNGSKFNNIGFAGNWWSASSGASNNTAWYRFLIYDRSNFCESYHGSKDGFSVRCLRD